MTDQVTTKVCSKCKVDKTFDSFGKKASEKYGLRGQCKICHNEESKAWCKANSEKLKAASKAWYKANSEKSKAASKAWYKANSEKSKAASKAWSRANPEKVRASHTAYILVNPEKVKASKEKWIKENPEKQAAASKAYSYRCNDNYVAKTMGLKLSQCPQELIELKRINILIAREIRNQQQCQN
jgi:hypothetical protein